MFIWTLWCVYGRVFKKMFTHMLDKFRFNNIYIWNKQVYSYFMYMQIKTTIESYCKILYKLPRMCDFLCINHHRILWPRTIFIMNCKFLFPLNLAQRIIPFQSMFIVVQYVHVLVFKQSQTWSPFIFPFPPPPYPKVHSISMFITWS